MKGRVPARSAGVRLNFPCASFRTQGENKKMVEHKELPVFMACYDLVLELSKLDKDFLKQYKYTVGESS